MSASTMRTESHNFNRWWAVAAFAVVVGLAGRSMATEPIAQRRVSTRGAEPRCATIRVSQRTRCGRETVLAAPQIRFVPGHDASVRVGNQRQMVEVKVRSIVDKQPIQHLVALTITRQPGGRPKTTVAAPKIIIADGRSGTIKIGSDGGRQLEMRVTVLPVGESRRGPQKR